VKLDSEEQRKTIENIINNIPLNGVLAVVVETARQLANLLESVKKAEIETPVRLKEVKKNG
jgi:hypothetical protein